MQIKISNQYPPNIDSIRRAFGPAAIRQAIFTYGNTVHIPNKSPLVAHLVAHEEVHVSQQGEDPEGWWNRYLVDPEFRLQQELEAYQAQYQFIEKNHDRKFRRMALRRLGKDLASPMYGQVISPAAAVKLIAQNIGA